MAGAGAAPAGLAAQWLFDEGVDGIANDATGNGNTATLGNGANWAEGVAGTAINFDGNNDYATVQPRTIPALQSPKSVLFFLWRSPGSIADGVGNGRQTCISLNDLVGGGRVQIGTDGGGAAMWFSGQSTALLNARPRPAGWIHVAYTYDGTRHLLYVDGAAEVMSTTPETQRGAVTELLFGTYGVNQLPNETCRGRLDGVRIYNRALTDAEVAQVARL